MPDRDLIPEGRADSTGWFEFITATTATTHIAYVYEDGSVYLPEGRDVVGQDDFTYAAARGRVYRLVRADDLEQDRDRIAELEQRAALAVAICDVEQLHKHDPGAPVPAIWTAYALRPDVYERPSDWDWVIAGVRKWHPTVQEVDL